MERTKKMARTKNTDAQHGAPDGAPDNGGSGKRSSRRRKPGPVPGVPTQRYTLLLEEETAEWGKRQPGGLSELVRGLLRRAREQGAAGS